MNKSLNLFSETLLAETNRTFAKLSAIDPKRIDFKNPYFTQPRDAALSTNADLLGLLRGNSIEHIYVHLPFCATRCAYCHYPTEFNEHSRKNQEALVEQRDVLPETCKTVHIGGGTPNCLDDDLLYGLLDLFQETFRPREELAIELYPAREYLSLAKLEIMAAAGVNRMSIGVQTFDSAVNDQNRRLFQPAEIVREIVREAISLCPNVSIDLLFGQKGQTLESFLADLASADQLAVNSIYLYQVRELVHRRTVDLEVGLNHFLHFFQQHGYDVVSFDQVIRRRNSNGFCAHRSGRSLSEGLLGIGPGAVSEVGPVIFRNIAPLAYRTAGWSIDSKTIVLKSARQMKAEYLNRGLRHFNRPGVDGFLLSDYEERFESDVREDFAAELAQLSKLGIIDVTPEAVEITPYGMLFTHLINYFLLGHYK